MSHTIIRVLPAALLLVFEFNLLPSVTSARMNCPAPPEQVSKNVAIETQGKAAALGKLGTVELKNKTEIVVKDLFDKVPNADRVLVIGMLTSLFCQQIDQSTKLSDKDKLDRISAFNEQMARLYNSDSQQRPTEKRKGNKSSGKSPGKNSSGVRVDEFNPNDKPENSDSKLSAGALHGKQETSKRPDQFREAREHLASPIRLTLYDLFLTDFSGAQKAGGHWSMSNSTNRNLAVEQFVVLDLERGTKFIQFYIPRWEDTFNVCVALSDLYEKALAEAEQVEFSGKDPGDTDVSSSKDTVFSKTVFVYHESELTAEQIGVLSKLYRDKGLRVQFRGSVYLFFKKANSGLLPVSKTPS